jgi:nicotinamidase-related amidase
VVVSDREFFTLTRTFIPKVKLEQELMGLVVVDMQYNDASADQGFGLALSRIEPGTMNYFNQRNESRVVPDIARLVSAFRERGLSVIFVRRLDLPRFARPSDSAPRSDP